MEKLTQEQIDQRVQELSAQYKGNISPIVFEDGEEQIIGYVQEPNRFTKLRALDKAVQSPSTAAADLLEASIIREASDPRIYSEKPEDDKYYIGAAMACFELVKVSVNQYKKK